MQYRIRKHPILPIPEKAEMVSFTCNGKSFQGVKGEPVATALIANGFHVLSRHPKDHAAKGIYCANGQCSHCTVIINGKPQKSCVTPLEENMSVRLLDDLPEIPYDTLAYHGTSQKEYTCDVLIVGGGPSGLTGALECAEMGYSVLIAEDKDCLGGKLLLQTHKFFGSVDDCYAGTRGIDIARILQEKVRNHPNIKILLNSPVVAIYEDGYAGVFTDNRYYGRIAFRGLMISAGARERSLIFPGNDLPGVYGAGAFQTLVNRDLVLASKRIFIVGSGNVGLIAAYHALQAGIEVAGICDILPQVTGYKVHADKIRRMGVPIWLNHTILSAEGKDVLDKITIARVDETFRPLLKTGKTFQVDTLLIAAGLTPIDEYYNVAERYGFPVVKAGDAGEIAEASSAMFGGRLAARELSRRMGKELPVRDEWYRKAELLKSKPGKVWDVPNIQLKETFQPVIHCSQEIPCNPCVTSCPVNAIRLNPRRHDLMDIPEYIGGCTGCGKCVSICPGLAIVLARKKNEKQAEVILPFEFVPDFSEGSHIPLSDAAGRDACEGEVQRIRYDKKTKTHLIHVIIPPDKALSVAGIRVQNPEMTKYLPNPTPEYFPRNALVCQCERVTADELIQFIRIHQVRDMNHLKVLRVGMGACGGKNCTVHFPTLFKQAGVDPPDVVPVKYRPLSVEIPLKSIVNEEDPHEKL
ncbi:MAG: soxA1 [Marinimicrobia bacterium 46_43]|nr:MAG: soxA1 [Marinimicrobia bacterium 46_43]